MVESPPSPCAIAPPALARQRNRCVRSPASAGHQASKAAVYSSPQVHGSTHSAAHAKAKLQPVTFLLRLERGGDLLSSSREGGLNGLALLLSFPVKSQQKATEKEAR